MKPEILEKIKRGIRTTNCYLPINALEKKIDENDFKAVIEENFLLLFEKSRYNFNYLYFYILDEHRFNLKNVFKDYNEELVLDIVFSDRKKKKWDLISEEFYTNGFKKHASFNRMFLNSELEENHDFENNQVLKPLEDDLIFIINFLEENFDIYAERIPTFDELKRLSNTTYLIKKKNEIAAVLISEKKGFTEELRYWLVSRNYRGKGFGSILMQYFLNSNSDTKRFLLWVQENNKDAIDKYKYFGFKKDNLNMNILKK